ncbi:MAG TPA: hypothetical protein VH740_24380 [Vicinamibacterales bacterium]|jgi:hypothetical protein
MLKTLLIVVGGLVAVVVLFVIWRIYATIAGGNRAYKARLAAIEPITKALAEGRSPSDADVLRFARDRVTRQVLFEVLRDAGNIDLFPSELRTWPLLAEADLVAWLCHPNELQAPPDEIELTATLPAPGAPATHYFLFRYKKNPPHWAAKDGWMAGVAGPYDLTKDPEPYAPGTFSRFEAYDSRTPEEHVAIHHRLVIERKGGEVEAQ